MVEIMSEVNQAEFKGWARVEVMGHQSHIGFVETQAFGQAVLFRIDHPTIEGVEETLIRAEWFDDKYLQPGSIVKRADIAAQTVLVGSGSIYRIVPCSEAIALEAIKSSQQRPLFVVKAVLANQITSGAVAGEQDDEEEDERPF